MYVVSGCPRSGTSVMMLIMRELLGEDRIVGQKFPQTGRLKIKKQNNESEEHFKARKYIADKRDPDRIDRSEKIKDMNPAGFWECQFTVQGLYYRPSMKHILKRDKEITQAVKVVSQGLMASNPLYIDKIVFMVRDPLDVAKSQERLRRGPTVEVDGRRRDIDDDAVVNTPTMFTKVTKQAARFMLDNPNIPVKLVRFKNLIEQPEKTVQQIRDFVGEGDAEAGSGVIDKKLHRSKQDIQVGGKWDEADRVFELLKDGRWGEILKVDVNETQRESGKLYCPRGERTVGFRQCMMCYMGGDVTDNFRKRAEREGVDWENEPCMWECGFCPDDNNPKTIEESVENNFWGDHQLSREELRRCLGELKRSLHNFDENEVCDRLESMVENHNLPPQFAVELSNTKVGKIKERFQKARERRLTRNDGRIDYTGCQSCKDKMLEEMKE